MSFQNFREIIRNKYFTNFSIVFFHLQSHTQCAWSSNSDEPVPFSPAMPCHVCPLSRPVSGHLTGLRAVYPPSRLRAPDGSERGSVCPPSRLRAPDGSTQCVFHLRFICRWRHSTCCMVTCQEFFEAGYAIRMKPNLTPPGVADGTDYGSGAM